MKRKSILVRRVISGLLCAALALSLVGCKKDISANNSSSSSAETSHTAVNSGEAIPDVDNAIQQVAKLGEDYGYENALSELTEKNTTTVDGDTYYRLQQNYQGIPVYGRTVVCAIDRDGNVTSITGNVQDIDQNINLTPSITSEQAQESIRAYVTEELEQADTDITISEPITCIYNGSKLAYVYTIIMDSRFFETHEVFVGAHDASILEWNTYAASFVTNQDILEEADVNCEFDESHNLRLADIGRNHSVHYLDLKTSQEYPMVEDVVGNSGFLATAVPDQNASGETHALAHLAQISDFYADVLGRQSYNNQEAPVYLFSCDADLLADQGKSLAYPEYGVIMLGAPVNRFSEHLGKALDLVAHEYAHLVFQTEVGLSQDLDVTSVNEGIADIFGNLIELYVDSEQDPSWPLAEDAGDIKYNMADPITMESYGNEEHNNAQILSHSAYLMWNGIDNDDSKKLTVQQLAELWYRAVLMMPSDCDFATCRELVEIAGRNMDMTAAQLNCIAEAFNTVGIENGDSVLIGTENTYLQIFGINNEPYNNYTLYIAPTETTALPNTPELNTVIERSVDTRIVTTTDPQLLNLGEGSYAIAFVDNADSQKYEVWSLWVNGEQTKKTLSISTDFGVLETETKQLSQAIEYDADGEVKAVHDFEYTSEGLLSSVVSTNYYSGGSQYEDITTFTYNENGQLLSSSSQYEGKKYTYDEKGLKVAANLGYGQGVYTYNDSGQMTRSVEQYDSGTYTTEYSYDANGLRIQAKEHFSSSWGQGDTETTFYYTYDSNGSLMEESYTAQDGPNNSSQKHRITHNYDYEPFDIMTYYTNDEATQIFAVLRDSNGEWLYGVSNYNQAIDVNTIQYVGDEDGYLTKLVYSGTSTVSLEFFYDETESVDINEDDHTNIADDSYDTLYSAFQNACPDSALCFHYDDFDADGTYEAFGITGVDGAGLASDVEIYYIASNGTVELVSKNIDLYGYCMELLDANGTKFLIWSQNAGGSGSSAYLFGVKNGTAYQPKVSGTYDSFYYDENADSFIGTTSHFSGNGHEYTPSYYEYDVNTGEFIPVASANLIGNEKSAYYAYRDLIISKDYENSISDPGGDNVEDFLSFNFALKDVDQDGTQELILDAMNSQGWGNDLVFAYDDTSGKTKYLGFVYTWYPVSYSKSNMALYYVESRPMGGEFSYMRVTVDGDKLYNDYSYYSSNEDVEELDWMSAEEMCAYLESAS